MVFPISDDNTGRLTTPYVTYALIALNVLVFVFLQGVGTNERFTYAFSTVPQEIRTGQDVARDVPVVLGDERTTIPLQPTPGSVYVTLLTSMFMHGSLMHLLGNMLFLWIFGDNVEDDLSHGRYTAFYSRRSVRLAVARRLHVRVRRQPVHPQPGRVRRHLGRDGRLPRPSPASPRARDHAADAHRGARLCRGRLWFVFQLISAFGVIGQGAQSGGGVAFMAHIGGFIAGVVFVKLFAAGSRPPARPHAAW
jgi:membrane associated rhomboid family serine protease